MRIKEQETRLNLHEHDDDELITKMKLADSVVQTEIYNTIILPALYGCKTWSLTLREERRLGVFEKRVLGKILGPERQEVAGEWRRLHSKELYDL